MQENDKKLKFLDEMRQSLLYLCDDIDLFDEIYRFTFVFEDIESLREFALKMKLSLEEVYMQAKTRYDELSNKKSPSEEDD